MLKNRPPLGDIGIVNIGDYDTALLTDWERDALQIAKVPIDKLLRSIKNGRIEVQNEVLRARMRFDLPLFLVLMMPDLFYFPYNDFHLTDLTRPKYKFGHRPETGLQAVAAPRGIAKTTIAKGHLWHDSVYGLERFVLVLSSGLAHAIDITKHLMASFSVNDSNLQNMYGPLVPVGGSSAFYVELSNGFKCHFLAKSLYTQVRGLNQGGQRPTKILVDEAERSDRVRNPRLRAEDWQLVHEDVLKVGPKEGGLLVDWRGTILHKDSILSNLLESPAWSGKRWASIISWPENQDLWNQCKEIWIDKTNPNRTQDAWRFYEAHRRDMDAGVEVLDPVAEPIYKLYVMIWSEGMSSFLKEKQNQPRSETDSYFDSSKFERFKVIQVNGARAVKKNDGTIIPLSELRITMRLDPIPGQMLDNLSQEVSAGTGDYAAIAVIGKDMHGIGYLLDVWMRRARDTEQLSAMWHLAEYWGEGRIVKATIETNGFQRLFLRDFRRQVQERKDAGEYWQVYAKEDVSTQNKFERIASLEPATSNRWLLFNEALKQNVFEQFDSFPTGTHDDAPDATEGAYRTGGIGGKIDHSRPVPGI